MKNRLLLFLPVLLCCLALSGCGEDPTLTKFYDDVDAFCLEAAAIGTNINNIDAQSDTAVDDLLGYLDQLDQAFKVFSDINVPEKFSYLEALADEASSYMTTAVEAYHEAYSNSSYNEYTAAYAMENYERACKRVNVLLQLLRGEEVTDADVTIEKIEETE